MTRIQTFLQDDSGAVTVDWVILCAGLVGLGLAVMTVVKDGTGDVAGDISTSLASVEVQTTLTLPES